MKTIFGDEEKKTLPLKKIYSRDDLLSLEREILPFYEEKYGRMSFTKKAEQTYLASKQIIRLYEDARYCFSIINLAAYVEYSDKLAQLFSLIGRREYARRQEIKQFASYEI